MITVTSASFSIQGELPRDLNRLEISLATSLAQNNRQLWFCQSRTEARLSSTRVSYRANLFSGLSWGYFRNAASASHVPRFLLLPEQEAIRPLRGANHRCFLPRSPL